MKSSKHILLVVFLGVMGVFNSIAQDASEPVKDDCITVQEIKIPFDGKQFVPNTSEETKNNYNLVYYTDKDEYTFWYKLKIQQDCNLKFSVKSSNPYDDYDFMLFKFASTRFCEAMVNNTVLPLNDNIYSYDNSTEEMAVANTIQSSQKQMKVKAGDVYYLSVMNIYGDDCGHRLYIDACNNAIVINSVHKPCFQFEQPKSVAAIPEITAIEEKIAANPKNKAAGDSIIVEDDVFVTGIVRDNDNGQPIDAMLAFIDAVTGKEVDMIAHEDGYKMKLERGRKYNMTCSAFGYYPIEGHIEFLKPSVYDFYLLKIKEGENFVMENILFHPSTYAFKEESFPELDKLVKYMTKNPKMKIEIQGHTAGDNPVTRLNPAYAPLGDEWNYKGSAQKLSKLRAESVKNYLKQKGVSSSRVDTEGFGASKRLIPNPKSKEERNKNMRVEVKITHRGEDKNYSLEPNK